MSTPLKTAESSAAEAPPKKSKKMLVLVIGALVLLLGGGAAAFLLLSPAHPPKHGEEAAEKHHEEVHPSYVELGTFTANLIREDGDRYLQVAISLKITKPELDEKIKASKPEILHRVNMLLQSRRPSDLATIEGKDKLASDLKAQVEYVLGIRKVAPALNPISDEHMPPGAEQAAHSAPLSAEVHDNRGGVADVLFTSFIVQ